MQIRSSCFNRDESWRGGDMKNFCARTCCTRKCARANFRPYQLSGVMFVSRASPTERSTRLVQWVLVRALRRWRNLGVVLSTILVAVATDLIKPWPMKLLIDNGLYHKA